MSIVFVFFIAGVFQRNFFKYFGNVKQFLSTQVDGDASVNKNLFR